MNSNPAFRAEVTDGDGTNHRASRGATLALSALICLLGAPQALADHSPDAGNDSKTIARPQPAVEDLSILANAVLGLRRSEIVELNLPQQLGSAMSVRIPLDGRMRRIDVHPHSIRAAGYRLLAQIEGGAVVPVQSGPVRTFRGSIQDVPGSIVAGSLEPNGLYATILLPDGRRQWIEPITGRVPGAPCCMHALYDNSDVLGTGGRCGVDDLPAHDPADHGDGHPFAPGGNGHPHAGAGGGPAVMGGVAGSSPATPCVTELACDADVEFYHDHGSSISQVESRINLVINTMNVQYETETSITHDITGIIVRTATPQPYTATDPQSLLNQFRFRWADSTGPEGDIPRDVAQLFTGKEIDGSVIGIAQGIGLICNDFAAFCLVQSDFGGGLPCATDLSAHELGHLWNCTHCNCADPGSTMNPYITCANHFSPVDSVPKIITHRNSRTCLVCGDPCTDQPTPRGQTVPLYPSAATDVSDDDNPQFATDGSGHWVAAWTRDSSVDVGLGTDADIIVARSSDGGVTWTTSPTPLSPLMAAADTGDDREPTLVTDGQGIWIAAWYSNNTPVGGSGTDQDIWYSRSTNNGVTWSVPTPLNTNAATDAGDDRGISLAIDDSGHWVAAWYSTDSLGDTLGTDFDILFARSTDGGVTWSAPAALNTNATSDSGADVRPQVSFSAGTWLAVWSSSDDLGQTIGTDDDILFARSTDAGVTWSAPAALNTNAATDSGSDLAPFPASDGQGHWIVVWYSTDTLGGSIDSDEDILVARSDDDGVTWSAPRALNSNAGFDSGGDYLPEIAYDGSGGWFAVWYSRDTLGGQLSHDTDIFYARGTMAGNKWSSPTWLNSDAELDHREDLRPHIARDVSGNWMAIWHGSGVATSPTGADRDIFITRFPLAPFVDCNDNGVADSCDIAESNSNDNDRDGIPDECQKRPPVVGDLTGDGHVNGLDLAQLLGAWTGPSTYAPCPPFRPADFDHDCRINGLDLALLLGNWG